MEVAAAEAGAVTTSVLGLFLAPCCKKICDLINLEKNRDSLEKMLDELKFTKSDIENTIVQKNLQSHTHYYKESDTVNNLFVQLHTFREDFNGLPKRRNAIMIVPNYKLGMKVVKLMEDVDKLSKEMKGIFNSKESLVIIDFKSTHSHYKKKFVEPLLRWEYAELGILKDVMKERIMRLISNELYLKKSCRVSDWLESMDVFYQKVKEVGVSFQTLDDDKSYNELKKDIEDVDQLRMEATNLSQQGRNLLSAEESLIALDVERKYYSCYRAIIVDQHYLEGKCSKLSGVKKDVERKVKALISSELYMKQSDIVSLWLSSVEEFFRQVTSVRDSFQQKGGMLNSENEVDQDMLNSINEVDRLTEKLKDLLEEGESLLSDKKPLAIMDVNLKYSHYRTELVDGRLKDECKSLENKKKDVEGKVKELLSLQPHMEKCKQVDSWLRCLDDFFKEVVRIGDSFQQNGNADTKLDSDRDKDMKKVDQLLEKAGKFQEEYCNMLSIEKNLLRTSSLIAECLNTDSPVISGHDKEFSSALHLIDDDRSRLIAISGMGGIGKTTLLKRINNHYYSSSGGGFDVVAYVHVGRETNVQMIQTRLCQMLSIDQNLGSRELLNYFRNKNSLFLIDDVWDKLEFSEIGIPCGNSGTAKKCKVVIATRSKQICNAMYITKEKTVKMEWLDTVESWKLFTSIVPVDETCILKKARGVAEKCGGLPLALVTVARVMMNVTDPGAWIDINKDLKQAAFASQVMDEVFSTLKFSFDRLKNNKLREILLYCSLYPQGHSIFVEDLIDLLIGEDLIDVRCREVAQRRSRAMIRGLVDVNLLIKHTEESVKLHDCVHKMAVWLTDGIKPKSELFLRWWLTEQRHYLPADFVRLWQKAKRASMLYGSDDGGDNPELQTLLWEMRNIDRTPAYAFTSMKNVRVLNLSNSSIEEIDVSIGCLLHLRYLNLKSTLITRLPKEVGNLTKLRQLILRDTLRLYHIPRESICNLHELEKLDMFGSKYPWRGDGSIAGDDREAVDSDITLNDLENLAKKEKNISDVSIRCHGEVLPSLVKSDYLLDSITRMELHSWQSDVKKPQLVLISKVRNKIQTLILHDFRCFELPADTRFPELSDLSVSHIKEVRVLSNNPFKRLVSLSVANCSEIEDFAWLASAQYLKVLKVKECEKLQTLLPSSSSFSSLKELRLIGCGSLERISCNYSLDCLRSLESLYIQYCSNLKELPFRNEGAAPKLVSIRGSNKWWENLPWGSESLKNEFHSRFSPLDP